MQNEKLRICVIGLGKMGSAIAEALLTAGYVVNPWNRTAEKAEALLHSGATQVDTAAKAAVKSDMVILCVSNHEASLSILETDGMSEALSGKLLVQFSTVTAAESRDLGRWTEHRGIAYLDGSILGYPEHVRGGNCTIVYSGPKNLFITNERVLAAMGGDPRHLGDTVGGAPVFDKAIYSYHYGALLAFFHGAAMCHAAGFPIELYTEQALDGGGATQRRCSKMIEKRSYDPVVGALEVDAAAYSHVVKLSEELGVDAEFPKLVASFFERALTEGLGRQEIASLFELMVPRNT
jgi:3-hydroxyisobutyrate dehydrogenase-like beta-hydroxyacid dehydrogenase